MDPRGPLPPIFLIPSLFHPSPAVRSDPSLVRHQTQRNDEARHFLEMRVADGCHLHIRPHLFCSLCFACFFLDSSCAFHAAPKYLLSTQYNTDVYIYMHAHLYEYTYTNSISMNTSEGLDRQIRRFPKSPLASRCRQERHITLKNSRINPDK